MNTTTVAIPLTAFAPFATWAVLPHIAEVMSAPKTDDEVIVTFKRLKTGNHSVDTINQTITNLTWRIGHEWRVRARAVRDGDTAEVAFRDAEILRRKTERDKQRKLLQTTLESQAYAVAQDVFRRHIAGRFVNAH